MKKNAIHHTNSKMAEDRPEVTQVNKIKITYIHVCVLLDLEINTVEQHFYHQDHLSRQRNE